MKNKQQVQFKESKLISLVFFVMFLFAFTLRYIGASKINLTTTESSYLLNFSLPKTYTESIFRNLINHQVNYSPNNGLIQIRLLNIFAGSIFTLLPFFVRKQLGNLASLLCGFFMAIDPFLLANSILITGNIYVLLITGIILVSLINKNYQNIILFSPLLFFGGRGFTYLLIISLVFFFLFQGKIDLHTPLHPLKEELKKEIRNPGLIILLISLFALLISKTRLDIAFGDFINFFGHSNKSYEIGNTPLVFLIAPIVYIPLAFAGMVSYCFGNAVCKNTTEKPIVSCIGIAFLFICLFPGHRVIDLVWVSVPIWAIFAIDLSKKLSLEIQEFKSNFVPYIILSVSLINLIFNFFMTLEKIKKSLPLLDIYFSSFTTLFFIIAMVIYWAYLTDIKKALNGLLNIGFILLFFFQIANTSRVLGTNGNPQAELFWDGYYPDSAIVDKILQTSATNQFGTQANFKLWVEKNVRSDVFWKYDIRNIVQQIGEEYPKENYLALITTVSKMNNSEESLRSQKFIAISIPSWSLSPHIELLRSDFWSWLLIRDSRQYEEYNYLWLSSD